MTHPEIQRYAPLLDIEIARDGDGRTVIAYAAAFGDPYEVSDFDGHYDETISRTAFDRTISQGAVKRARVLFNHGMTIYGTPSERYAMPLGTPVDIKADGRGLLTTTRYAKTPLGDEVLELIRSGAIRGMSFRGAIYRSARPVSGRNGRPLIERLELGLKEYGPAPFPANAAAEIVAVRTQLLADEIGHLTPEERRELIALLSAGTSLDPPPDDDTPPETPPPVAETPDPASSPAALEIEQAQRRRRLA